MGKYLKKFETTAAYNAAKPNLILPNVSLITETHDVEYNPSTPPTPSHDYVEIGGTKWATMNVGATAVTDSGLFFQWGDTQGYTAAQVGSDSGQKYFGWEDYKYTNDGGSTMTKYNDTDGLTALTSDDDAVTAAWGEGWRMPTTEEFQALESATTSAWTTDYQGVSGCNGLLLTSTADTNVKLFFPAVGDCGSGGVDSIGGNGYYWSSSLYGDIVSAYGFGFNSGSVDWQGNYERYGGCAVRGVVDE